MYRFEKLISKLFIFSFPFKMIAPFAFLGGITYGLGDVSSFLFCVIGVVLAIMRGRFHFGKSRSDNLFKQFILLYLICDLASIIMSLLLYKRCGYIGGENTIIATTKKILFSLAYILFVYYCREIGGILTLDEIFSTIEKTINVCLVVGIIQIGILYNISIFEAIYNAINSLFDAWTVTRVHQTGRIALLANEPAYSAGFLGIVVFPYLLSKFLVKKNTFGDFVKLFLCVVILYFTKSTTGYILLPIIVVFFVYLYFKNSHIRSFNKVFLIVLIVISVFAAYFVIKSSGLLNDFMFVIQKLTSSENENSTDRKAIIAISLIIFKNYPVLGVGNGNQGFFYREFAPAWAIQSFTGARAYRYAENVLYDGGPFWLAYISGYGLLGIVLLVLFFKNCIKNIKLYKNEFPMLYYFYILSLPMVLVDGTAATLGEKQYFWFVLSIPMMLQMLSSRSYCATSHSY